MQRRGRRGLIAKSLEMLGVKGGGERQHLQGDASTERKLDRLVDHAHAAVTDLADDLKISQRVRGQAAIRPRECRRRVVADEGGRTDRRLVNEVQPIETLRQRDGNFRVSAQELRSAGRLASLQLLQVLLNGRHQARIIEQVGGTSL